MRRAGFTLVETLIAMALSLLIMAAGLEFFVLAQKTFLRLKDKEEAGQSALAASDKIRIDLLHAGLGLAVETALGIVEPMSAEEDELRTVSVEKPLVLAAEARAGDLRLALAATSGIAAGQDIALRDGAAGEVRRVAAVERTAVVLREPLGRPYSPATAAVALLETVVYFLDEPAGILRRRVNASPAQPLLENARAASWSRDPSGRVVRVRLELSVQGGSTHETTVFLKNPALAGLFQ